MSKTFRKVPPKGEFAQAPKNPYACDPIMGKGSSHAKSKATARQAGKSFIDEQLRDDHYGDDQDE